MWNSNEKQRHIIFKLHWRPRLDGHLGLHVLGAEGDGELGVFGDLDDLGQLAGQSGGFLQVWHGQDPHSGRGNQDLTFIDAGALDSNEEMTKSRCLVSCV